MKPFDTQDEKNTALGNAIGARNEDEALKLIREGADVNEHYTFHIRGGALRTSTPLHDAALSGQDKVIDALINKGATLDAQDDLGQTALMNAARMGYVNIVRALVAAGANSAMRDENNNSTLDHARKNIRTVSSEITADIIKMLDEADAKKNSSTRSRPK